MCGLRLPVHLHFAVIITAFRAAAAFRPAGGCATATVNARIPSRRRARDRHGERRHRGAVRRGPHRVSRFYFRVYLHSAAAVITAFRAAIALRPAGGCATATATAGIEAPCAETRTA